MKKILIINPYYYPGFRSGGPQQTIMNIVDAFGKNYSFYILTSNHDLGSSIIYDNIDVGWNDVGNAKVFYANDRELNYKLIAKLSKEVDLIYSCGLFERTTINLLIANKKKLINCSIIVAPMGVFSNGAISQKYLKKRIFLFSGKLLGLFKNIYWSFSSQLEVEDFKKHMGYPKKYEIAMDIPRNPKKNINITNKVKKDGELNVIFLSRICPTKNLELAIEIISKLYGKIQFDIYGTKEDIKYWNKCENKLKQLPKNIKWKTYSEVSSDKVIEIFSMYDVFLFPTLGENFGHVIYESLLAGCIPVISNNTPWQDLDKKNCGSVVNINKLDLFIIEMEKYIDMNNDEFQKYKESAKKYAFETYHRLIEESGYKKIFNL